MNTRKVDTLKSKTIPFKQQKVELYCKNISKAGPVKNGSQRLIGIEIEVENAKDIPVPLESGTWGVKPDGSLRNHGAEFVTIPIPFLRIKDTLKFFYKEFHTNKFKSTYRCAFHVHVDCRNFTVSHLQTLTGVHALIEPALFLQFSAEREENIYCIPWYRSDEDVVHIHDILYKAFNKQLYPKKAATLDFILKQYTKLNKYSSFYLEPLYRFGTVEFRHAPTFISAQEAIRWVNICHAIVEYSYYTLPEQAWTEFNDLGPHKFAQHVTNKQLDLPLHYNNKFEECDSEILGQLLLFAHNYNKNEKKIPKEWVKNNVIIPEIPISTPSTFSLSQLPSFSETVEDSNEIFFDDPDF